MSSTENNDKGKNQNKEESVYRLIYLDQDDQEIQENQIFYVKINTKSK